MIITVESDLGVLPKAAENLPLPPDPDNAGEGKEDMYLIPSFVNIQWWLLDIDREVFYLETLVSFTQGLAGRLVMSVLILLSMLSITGILLKKEKLTTKMLTYAAICIALATALSYVKLFEAPYGGAVTLCSMFFIALAGYWFGPAVGIIAGVSQGMLQFVIDPYIVHPIQMLLDYPIAFGLLGLSGCFKNRRFGLQVGFLAGVLGRFLASTISGYVFFADNTPEGMQPLLYSISYNAFYMGIEYILTMVIVMIPAFRKAIDMVKTQTVA